MKQELPIAGLLLAVGSLLWCAGSLSSQSASASHEHPPTHAPTDAGDAAVQRQEDDHPQDPNSRSRAKPDNPLLAERRRQSQQHDRQRQQIDDIQLQSPESFMGVSQRSRSVASFLHPTSDPRAVQWLTQLSGQTAQSPPLGASLQLTTRLFDQALTADGRYFQAGQGTHQARLELAFGTGDDAATVFQLCDGRFVYRLETIGGQQVLEFVDLREIRQQAGEQPSPYSPTGWMATGGLSSLYQHVGSAFNFGPPERLDGTPAASDPSRETSDLILRGSWNPESLYQMLGQTHPAAFSGDASAPRIVWEQIPPQIPHGIEVILTRTPLTGYFPRHLSYLRFVESESRGGSRILQPLVNIAFSAPRKLESVNEQMFVIDTSDAESIDATDRYLARIQSITSARWAAREQQTQQQTQ